MAKFTFDKSTKKTPRPIAKTDIAKPRESYDPSKVSQQIEEETSKSTNTNNTSENKKRPVGRPKSGRKSYQTVRLQKQTVLKINALENALSIATQDETVDQAIDRVLNSLTNDEKRSYRLWLNMFEKKEKAPE